MEPRSPRRWSSFGWPYPRRTYTQSHIDYVGEVIAAVLAEADQLTGLRIVEQARWLRHFTAALAPVA